MRSLVLVLLSFTFIASQSNATDVAYASADSSRLFNPEDTNHIILVSFSDQQIKRIQGATQSSAYRRRGEYKSSSWSRRISSEIANEYHLFKMTEWPITEISMHCVVYLVPQDQSMAELIEHLTQDKRVDLVQKMNQFETNAHKYNDPYIRLQSSLSDMSINKVHTRTTGQGITIAIIDTGVETEHLDLIGKVDVNTNFATDISPSFSNDKHGTAVAGIIAARSDNDVGIIGVAPNARLVALKACWPNKKGSYESICNSFTLALAINKAIELDVNIMNMSLTGPKDPLLEILLNRAVAKGIIVVAADSGVTETNNRFPASLQSVIPVQTSRQSETSGLGQNLSINAPGINILTTIPNNSYDFVSGSSIAAAHVSGVIALLMELNSALKLTEVVTILHKSNSTIPSINSKPFFQGINAQLAVEELCKRHTCTGT